jgi:hypothetical protein
MDTNKQIKKGNVMTKTILNKKKEEKVSAIQIIGGLMIGFAVVDFAASYAGLNLTSFLGSASRYSPIIFGLIGSSLINIKNR